MNFFRTICCLLLLISTEQVISAVSISITAGNQVIISPGVDVSREIVATMLLNSDQAYNISLNDDTGGVLRNGGLSMPYRMSYNNNSEITLSINPTVVDVGNSITDGSAILSISILGSDTATASAGNYTTTLTLTITGL